MLKWAAAVCVLALSLRPAAGAGEKEPAMRVITFNIRFDNPADGANAWPHRRDWVAEILREQAPDVVGLQEVLPGQLQDLQDRLPEYTAYSVGRQDGKAMGEASPILFRSERFELLDKSTFWLSLEPERVGSVGWDAALPRICSWVRLKNKTTGAELYAFNTHFDHRGADARLQSARLLVRKISEIAGKTPALLTGDFNCRPDRPPYLALTTEGDGLLRDTRGVCTGDPLGPDSTWNGFLAIIPGQRIDYVYTTRHFEVTQHHTLTNSRDGRFPSDHLPILVELQPTTQAAP